MTHRDHRRLTKQTGTTLLETMIGLFVASIIVSAVTHFYVNQHYHVNQQRNISDLQQNLRASMQELTDHIRMAGYGMPSSVNALLASDANPDTIQVIFKSSPDAQATIEHAMPQPSSELRCDGHDVSAFQEDTWAYIYDPSTETGEYFLISHVQPASFMIQHNKDPLSRAYPKGSLVISISSLTYFVDRSDSTRPVLMRSRLGESPQVFSESIEDLQLRYQLVTGAWTNAPVSSRLVRVAEIGLTARAPQKDPIVDGGIRRRALTTQVTIPNLRF